MYEIKQYLPYEEIAAAICLRPKDRVYLSSDLLALAWTARKNGEDFSADRFIESFQEQLTPEGTLLVPTFHFDFSNKGIYDYKRTPSASGALGNAALHRKDFKRTAHPMHSFCIWGKDQELLCGMQNLNSFGNDSPFAYMKDFHVIQVMVGTDYSHSMTFVHYVEAVAKVPYRFFKQFSGSYIDERGTETVRTYEYPARDLELGSKEQFNRIGKKLEERGIAKVYSINEILVRKVDLAESFPLIYEDAVSNRCRNLYDFKVNRERIWTMEEKQ